MSDILLLNPYYSQKRKYYTFYRAIPPLGLMYLSSYLRKHKIETKIYELGIFEIKDAINLGESRIRFGISDQKIRSFLKTEKPKIVGITSMYSIYYRDVMEIAETVKKFDSKIKVVIGGNHPSDYWHYVLKDKNIDFVVLGEGEESFKELCQTILAGKKTFDKINGIAFRKGGKIVKTLHRKLIMNLDEIPFPAIDKIDFPKYLQYTKSQYTMRYPQASIITSRGCPQDCVYCTVKAVWGRSWRGRSAKNVVDEVEMLIKQYGIREVAFLDDSASVRKKRWGEICDEIVKRKLDFRWTTPNGIAHWTLDKPTIKKMKRAGCYRITFGIESGNIKTRKFLGKPFPLKQAESLIKYANKIGMWTICTNIIGFPYEKMDSIRDTINFAKKCGTDFAPFYLLIPQPTSDVYDYFRKENLLNLDHFFEDLKVHGDKFEEINYVLNETGTDTTIFKKEELRAIQKKAYQEFITYRALSYLLNPLNIIRKIRSWEDFQYTVKLLTNGFSIFKRTLLPSNMRTGDYLYKKPALDYI